MYPFAYQEKNIEAYRRDIVVVAVGPKEAEEFLSRGNTDHVDWALVTKYAEEMIYDRWRYPGGVIEITSSGKLKDGHHRLLAIRTSGITLPMIIVDNLPEYDVRGD